MELRMGTLWEKIQFWKKLPMNKYSEGKDYRFYAVGDGSVTGVELLIDGYEGVCYHYHQARIVEENGIAKLQFGYTLLYSGKYDIDVLNSDEELFIIMGEILEDILLKKLENEQTRTDNPEESDIQ
jgi:hypothetical protein